MPKAPGVARPLAIAASNSRFSSSTVCIPGRTGNLAIAALRLFSSGHSARRALDRASLALPPRRLVIAAARHRRSQSPSGQAPLSTASRI